MSKRGPGANFGGDEERYGGYSNSGMDNSDKPMKATAAQLARRKIASTKKPATNRSRAGSPAFPPATANAQQAMQQQPAAFNSNNFSFSFGQQATQTQNGGPPATFNFGASTPAPSFAPQQNGTPNPFTQSAAPTFGANMNSNFTQPNQNGLTSASSFGSTQPLSQQTNAASSFGGFGQTQQSNATPATATTSTFGSFGKPQDQNGATSFLSGQTQAPQQTLSGNMFGFGASQQKEVPKASTPFGGFGATQQDKQEPKQNGFSSGAMFGQKPQDGNDRQGTPSFGAFGQKPQETTNTPSNLFASSLQKTQENSMGIDKSSTAFGGLGQKTQENNQPTTPSNSFFGLGQKPQENGQKPNSMFAGIGQKAQENGDKPSTPFAGFGQKAPENGDKTSSMFTKTAQTPQMNGNKSNSVFAGLAQKPAEDTQKSSNLWAGFQMQQPSANKEKAQDEQPPKAGTFGQPQQNGEKTQAPMTSAFSFGQSQATSQSEQPASKPATSNIFGANTPSQSDQPNGVGKGLFGASLTPLDAPKGASSIFDSVNKSSGSNNFNFSSADPSQVYKPGDDQDDDDENGEESTDGNIFGQSAPKTPAEQPKTGMFNSSVFPSTSQKDTSMNTSSNIPPKSLFQNQPPSMFEPPATSSAADASGAAKPRSLFDRMEPADQAKILASSKAASPQKSFFDKAPETPATTKPLNLFAPQTTSTTPAAPSMFQPSQSAAESQTPKAPPMFQKPAAQQSMSGPFTPAASSQQAAPSTAFKAPATAPPARAAAPASRAVKASGPMVAADGLSSDQEQRLKSLNEGMLGHLQGETLEQDWTKIFQYYIYQAASIRGVAPPTTSAVPAPQTNPSAPATGSLFSNANKPAAPKAFESSTNMFSQASKPASASTFSAQTPKQPDAGNMFKPPATAPPASKKRIFEEDDDDDDEPAKAPGSEKRSKPNEPLNYPKLPETASSAAKLFESSLDKSKSTPGTATGGFNPSTKSMFSTSTGQTPSATTSAPAFKPPMFTAPASGNSFLSAFGKKAEVQVEKERKKRKANDYDSDDETPEEWEKRDREEQEAKRVKIAEASKSGTGFKFSGATSTKPVTAKEVEKAQGPGDNTWKPETPIKFGGSTADTSATPALPPPKLDLFGSSATPSTTEAGKLAPPSTNFSFGPKTASLNTSRATTPGVTTDGEASNAAEGNDDGEPSDEPKDAQIDADDMTALLPVEIEENEVLLELKNVKSKKFVKTDDNEKPQWVSKGDGRAYLLKNKATGKTRILQKVGVNQLALNFEPVRNMKYELHPKKDTMVVATFFDHIHSQPAKLDRFFITTDNAENAQELVRILTEGATN